MLRRKLLQSKAIAIAHMPGLDADHRQACLGKSENDLRGTLRNFGLKVGTVGSVRFEARIRELVEIESWGC